MNKAKDQEPGSGLRLYRGAAVDRVCLKIPTPGVWEINRWTEAEWARLPESQRPRDALHVGSYYVLATLTAPLSCPGEVRQAKQG